MKEGSFTAAAGVAPRKALVTSQIALALVLLIGAGLFVRTLESLRAHGPGFATTNLLMFGIRPAKNGYTAAQSSSRTRDLLAALRALPEVQSVGLARAGLLTGGSWNQQLTIESGRRTLSDGVVQLNAVSPDFFGALGVAFISGRDFNERDARDPELFDIRHPAYRSAIVNERFARHYFGDRNPIGARLGLGNGPDTRADIEIVGVVRTFSYRSLRMPKSRPSSRFSRVRSLEAASTFGPAPGRNPLSLRSAPRFARSIPLSRSPGFAHWTTSLTGRW